MFTRSLPMGLLLALLSGCASDWKIVDSDGDGLSPADGDCWDGAEGPPGSGLSGADIYPGAPDTPYDGFDADCAGNDDYDLDGDGYVTEEAYVGLETYAVAGTGTAELSGDCWDDPDVTPDGYLAINDFDQPTAFDVHPDAEDIWYDAVDANCAGDDDFDADADGFASSYYADSTGAYGDDCFDADDDDFDGGEFAPGEINPDATEFCGDVVDNDCDTLIDGDDDDAEAVYWYPDDDEDAYGDIEAEEWTDAAEDAPAGYAIRVCEDPSTKDAVYVVDNTDCDDAESTTNPGADEYCDGHDDDCDSEIDEDSAVDAVEWWADDDGDAYGDSSDAITTCYQPSGYVENEKGYEDCDDNDANTCPGCAQFDSLSACMEDGDGDGYGNDSPGSGVTIGSDCDDTTVDVSPAQVEADWIGNNVDNDCDGFEECYYDIDDDGYLDSASGTITSTTNTNCTDTNEGEATDPFTDCDDSSDTTYPGAAANDSTSSCMKDDDGDGYGDDSPPSGVTEGSDCNDADSAIEPTATEGVGDEVDQNCDGSETCYEDSDDDGYIDSSGDTRVSGDTDCTDAYEATNSALTGDCDDDDATANPGETEIVGNNNDNDCDGTEDCYDDADDDDYHDGNTVTSTDEDCTDSGEAEDSDPSGDCDNADADVNPGEDETDWIGNNVDNDCDGTELCYEDDDNDGFLDDSEDTIESANASCADAYEGDTTTPTTDCDDDDANAYPGNTETVGDENDNDCDGNEVCYEDTDDDGYLDTSGDTITSTDEDCDDAQEADSSTPTTDCDDDNADANPSEDETDWIGNEVDNDCDGTELCYHDDDDDGYLDTTGDYITSTNTSCADAYEGTDSTSTDDCDDNDADAYPGNSETVGDENDNDCDGNETCYADVDGDGYHDGSTVTSANESCANSGELDDSAPSGDCDDNDADANPGEPEVVGNNNDNDCDGTETCYVDADDDGYLVNYSSTVSSSNELCTDSGEGEATDPDGDCNDSNGNVNPGETEVVDNGLDNDCDGFETCYVDADADGYRPDSSSTVESSDTDCTDSGEAESSDPTTDCDDEEETKYPGADEICGDGIVDQDCDGDEEECSLTDLGLLNANTKLAGSSATDEVGDAVLMADLTGDGDLDLLVGATDLDTVYMVTGPSTSDVTLATGADETFTGADTTGFALASAGDINNDGYEDVLMGAYLNDSGDTNAGTAYLLLGPSTGGALSSVADVTFNGEVAQQRVGISLAGAGDQNGDGRDDFLIGAERGDENALDDNGAAYLIFGSASPSGTMDLPTDADAILWGEADNDGAGRSVSTAGDVDGDGTPDVLVGAYYESTNANNAGAAYLVYGPVTTDSSLGDGSVFYGAATNDFAGHAVTDAGDTNDDGYDDILVGAYGADEAYLFLGQASSLSDDDLANADAVFSGEANNDRFGYSVSAGGNLNGDTNDDILIAADKAESNDGELYVYYGPFAGAIAATTADVVFVGQNLGRAGTSLDGGQDYNDDGFHDIMVGSNAADSDYGAAYLILGTWE